MMRVGMIGNGFSAKAHLEALRRISNVEIVAISGKDKARISGVAKSFQIPKIYTDYKELIDDKEVEVIHNCTPNYLHVEVIEYALKRNKHIISEKPLSLDSKESEKLLLLAEKSNSLVGLCFNYRFYPMVQQMKSMITQQEHGRPFLVRGGYVQDWLSHPTDYNWRLDTEMNGPSRAIADIGSHWCDTVQYILGKKIKSVFADLETVYKERYVQDDSSQTFQNTALADLDSLKKTPITTEDFGNVLVQFENGIKGSFTVSQVTPGRKNHLHFEISSEEAAYYWDQEKPNKLWIGKRNEPNMELLKDSSLLNKSVAKYIHYPGGHQEGWPDTLKNQFLDFYQHVESKEDYSNDYATLYDGHQIMKLIDAILKSNERKEWVSIS